MNLDSYCARIGYTGARQVSYDTLAAIVYRHALSIPFENVDAFLGRRVSLDPDAVAAKLVDARRGGWCFEQNLLLGEALRSLGFDVTDLAARVLLGRPADAITPRSHRVLLVKLQGRSWLADVGFGAQLTPTAPLDLETEDEQPTPHGPYRLVRSGPERRLEALSRAPWVPLFRFDLQPQHPVDFEAANFQLVHDPASHFTQQLGVSVVVADGRHGLRSRELISHDLHGNVASRMLDTAGTLHALRDVFGLRLDEETAAAVAARLDAQDGAAVKPG